MRKILAAAATQTMVNRAVNRMETRICQTGGPGGIAIRSIIIMGVAGGNIDSIVENMLLGDFITTLTKKIGIMTISIAGVIKL